jgi:hypothetical protein
MKDRSSRSALTTYGIALAVVFAIIGLLWLQKAPETKEPQVEQVQEPTPTPQPEPIQPVQGGTVGAPVLGTVDTVTPAPDRGNPYGPLGPFGPGGPGGPAGPSGPSGSMTPPE